MATVKDQVLLEKSEKVLKANIYPANSYCWGKYRMISPDREHFKGIWNWDSAFHAIGMLAYDEELAKEQVLGFLQFQKEDGMLPDVIWETGKMEDAFSKPPVMTDAAWRVYQQTKDMDFLRSVYPAFVKNEGFWTSQRMDDGMFHFDARSDDCSVEKYRIRVGYESGMDDSPRWDISPAEYWAIDLNCYMVQMYRALAKMAEELGEDGKLWQEKEKALIASVEERLWDENQQAYVDRNRKTMAFSTVLTPCSFLPLYVGFAAEERAAAMHRIAVEQFMPGMPTVSYRNPEYSDGYWRGRCWLNMAYFALKGQKNYGYEETANTMRETILDWAYSDGDCIHENYNATTGKGMGVAHFLWSAVFVRERIENF